MKKRISFHELNQQAEKLLRKCKGNSKESHDKWLAEAVDKGHLSVAEYKRVLKMIDWWERNFPSTAEALKAVEGFADRSADIARQGFIEIEV